MNQKEIMAYLAGIIDGEGYLGIRKITSSIGNPCYYDRMCFYMQDKRPAELFAKFFGNKIIVTRMKGKKYYGIAVGSDRLEKILKELLPCL